MNGMTQSRAERLVRQYMGCTAKSDQDVVIRIAERMVSTGDCVWHAASVVTGNPCGCYDCKRPSARRGR
jgi:hypothetical protein